LYAENWLMSFDFPPGNSNFLNHFWSLAVEEQFYMVWPPIVFLIKKPRILFWVMMVLLLTAIGSRYYIWSQHIADLNYTTLYTFTRIDGICVGALVALLRKIDNSFLKRNLSFVVLAVAAINFIFYFFNQPYGVLPYLAIAGYTTFAFLFGVLVNEVVSGEGSFIHKTLTIKPLMYIGKISYGFYVFHWPVYAIIADLLGKKTGAFTGTGFTVQLSIAIIATSIAFAISVLSYHFFESKFLRLKKHFT
jgi:peptidoglycan/LPS O-acetylase OafA/YrhL